MQTTFALLLRNNFSSILSVTILILFLCGLGYVVSLEGTFFPLLGIIGIGVALLFQVRFPQFYFLLTTALVIIFWIPFILKPIFSKQGVTVYPIDLILATLCIYVAIKLLSNNSFFPKVRSFKLFTAYAIWGVISIMIGFLNYGPNAIGYARIRFITICLYFYLILGNFTFNDIRRVVKYIFIAVALNVVLNLLQHYVFHYYWPASGWRRFYTFLEPVETFGVTIAFIFLLVYYVNGKLTRPYLPLLGVLPSIILWVQNRSTWVVTATGTILTLVLFKRKSRRIIFLALGIILVMVLTTWILGIEVIHGDNPLITSIKRSATVINPTTTISSLSMRLSAWHQQLDLIKDSPLIGYGFGKPTIWSYQRRGTRDLPVHNGYIMRLIYMGGIGVLLYLSGIMCFFLELRNFIDRRSGKSIQLYAYWIGISLFANLLFITVFDETYFFWILIGLGTMLMQETDSNVAC